MELAESPLGASWSNEVDRSGDCVMRYFEHDILIHTPRPMVYEHLARPENLMGLQPLLTAVDVLEETFGADGAAAFFLKASKPFELGISQFTTIASG